MSRSDDSKLFNYVRSQPGNKCRLDQLKIHFRNVETTLTNNSIFFIQKVTSTKWQIRAKLPLKLCYIYQKGKLCNGQCDELHLCKRFLCFEGACDLPCQYSHDLCDNHNNKILSKFKVTNANIDIVRSSFPRICKEFLSSGSCRMFNCGSLHLCEYYARESCQTPCPLVAELNMPQHILHGLSSRNRSILSNFQLTDQELFANVILNVRIIPARRSFSSSLSMVELSKVEQMHGTRNLSRGRKAISSCSMNQLNESTDCDDEVDDKRAEIIKLVLNINPRDASCSLTNPKLMALFKNDENETEQFIRNHNKSFRLVENMNGKKTIHLCLVDVEPCLFYWGKGGGCKKRCGRFHVCRKYVFSNHNINTCKYFHLDDPSSKLLVEKNQLENLSKEQILTLLRKRYPYVCKEFQNGSCSNGDNYCQQLHMCKDFRLGKCIGNCGLPHQSAYESPQAARISECFSIPLKFLATYLMVDMNETTSANDFSGHEQKLGKVIHFILNNDSKKGRCSLDDYNLLNFNNKEEAKLFFESNRQMFRILTNQKGETFIYVCLGNIQPCIFYWGQDGGCKKPLECQRFHVCRKMLFEENHIKTDCSSQHLDDTTSQNLISKLRLQSFSKENILTLLRNRYPLVCKEFQNGCCVEGEEFCPMLHICEDFQLGECNKQDDICRFPHEKALKGKQAKWISESFNIQMRFLKRYLMVNADEPSGSDIGSASFNAAKEEGLCVNFLNGICKKPNKCSLEHFYLPYLWQYKKSRSSWNDFNDKMNKEIEISFCTPAVCHHEMRFSTVSSEKISINFLKINNGIFADSNNNNYTYRRLSTKSKLFHANDLKISGYTQWKWFWKESDDNWEEYKEGITSDAIETAYVLGDPSVTFKTGKFKYKLIFSKMVQQNQDERYLTMRQVTRRPIFLSIESSVHQTPFPSTWPSSSTLGETIDVDATTRQKLEQDFLKSIGSNHRIVFIKEVCNREFYEKYIIKKKQMERKGKKSNEMYLYHGTSHDTVDGICAQNFDFRLSGKNATIYGRGSYFATSASYSHQFCNTNPSGHRFMFVAQVLAGSYAKGDSSMTRPPLKNQVSLELYDSCVDNTLNPSMYIIFNLDQCYPRYLIKYI